ncbi:MAG TPA: double-strand break repair helicase AddA [Alphaproteobacteria bacterium]|nr:MAG: double-strand break repair helicase AddA [Rhodospirillales bacterium]HOO80928.1 double-strand break repair helicase AddA [Alphaproteobacteria bacterium]
MSAQVAPRKQTETVREVEPNVLQRRASRPDASVWVSASAGTGKTKVLTDRVLRLLLPREERPGQIIPGAPAHKILCLTFTKAAASEMALRISKTLSAWAIMPLDGPEGTKTLYAELRGLLGRAPSTIEIKAARKLFADTIDVPGGLKIMTIHAFCQSILGRFPLEAGINPHLTILEDSASEALLTAARNRAFANAEKQPGSELGQALERIAATINEDQFLSLLNDITRERRQLARLKARYFDLEGLYSALCVHLGIAPHTTPQNLLNDACSDESFNANALRSAALTMQKGKGQDQTNAEIIFNWLAASTEQRMQDFSLYQSAFLKKSDGQIKARLALKNSIEANPEILDILTREGERLIALKDAMAASSSAALTRDILILGESILDEYEILKTGQGALDFDDLILKTLDLLRGKSMGLNAVNAGSWVHYKLDQGLDHILIDEAQDTNPEQWQIIEALCDEFYSNAPDNNMTRTVFTVGDEKQSIYSFQRASPEEFARMQSDFERKTKNALQTWDSVPMNISFRSTSSVLNAVDSVFAAAHTRKGLSALPIEHTAFRRGQAGLVELWPLFESDECGQTDLWTPLTSAEEAQTGRKKLSVHIAKTIKTWLSTQEILPSKACPIRPGDIMILVRTRSNLVNQIAYELKNLNVPVSGLDRMVLSQELAVQDLLAAAECALQPLDDLTLASVLKSPLIGLNEDEIFNLSAYRGKKSLWESLQASDHQKITAYLKNLLTLSKKTTPFEFFSHILQSPCPTDTISARRAIMRRLGKDTLDPLDELLSLARTVEKQSPPSLQKFIHDRRASHQEIKREHHSDNGETDGEVRIMTIHGSKGLQAPIVILPDTITSAAKEAARAEKRLLWPNQTGLNLPLWSPRKECDYQAYREAMGALNQRLDEEYRRLLYVAMTRAEDRLYIGGALGKSQSPEKLPGGCWYDLIAQGLQNLEDIEDLKNGGLRLTNPQIHEPEKPKVPGKTAPLIEPTPQWLHTHPPSESQTTTIIRPSHIADTAISPLQGTNNQRFVRGNLTHKLLQLLPTIPRKNWENTAQAFLKRYAKTLSAEIRGEIACETLKVLNHPDFAPLFGPGSMAEVPISGHLEGKGLISGQIDRLYIDENTISIIDYKTNRPPPENPAQIPEIYRSQMHTYAAVLKKIYPGRTIHAALLWTDGPILMPLDLKIM